MSEKKTKVKKIIVSILIVTLIATAICVFLVTKNKNKNNKTPENPAPVGQSSSIEAQINSDVINQKVCVEYDGNYIFKAVVDLQFGENLSTADENKIYYSVAKVNDKNSFIHYLSRQKNPNTTNEIITFVNGKYIKSIGSTNTESGLYFGNLNKSLVYTLDSEGTTIIDNKNYSISFEISQTGYWLTNTFNSSNDIVYIREKFKYGNIGEKYFYVTYAYQMI